MAFWLPAAIAGGASLLGGLFANKANKAAAQRQMDFQERMSSTAYQRATADMRASGINPMLAYQQGGASSPGGAAPQMEDVIGPAVSSAQHARRLSAELKLLAAQEYGTRASANAAQTQAGLNQMHTNMIAEQMKGVTLENTASAAHLVRTLNEASVERSRMGKWLPWLDRIRESILPWAMAPRQITGGRLRTSLTAPTTRY